jgi:alpha-tubulin suppressor-like RCC1 family protein
MSLRLLLRLVVVPALVLSCTDSPVEPDPDPDPEPEPTVYLDITAGPDRSCAIREDRVIVCWGRHLFSGPPESIALSPQPIPDLLGRQVALGDDHSCLLLDTGAVVCGGSNQHGQGGREDPSRSEVPVPVADTLIFETLSAGARHTCGRTEDDQVWCWGYGSRGSIGSPDLSSSHRAVHLGGGFRSYTAFDVSGYHGCALGADAEVYCWGWNGYGQLGVGVFFDLGSPERIARPGPYAAIFTGATHSCALDTDGAAWCWGRGDAGQLGHGQTAGSAVPVPVAGGHSFVRLALGLDHSCGIRVDGAAFCWGHNRHGRLGTGGLEVVVTEPAAVATELRFHRISAGLRHTCALTADRHAYCWGHGAFGQLGTGSTISEPRPTRVAEPE